VTLSGGAESSQQEPATSSLEAYRAVLVSRQFSLLRSPGSLQNAVDQARKAMTADPGYADAHLALALAETRRVELGLATDAERGEAIRAALDRALKLAPDHPQAWSIRGRYLWLDSQQAALPALEQAMRLDPGNLTAVFAYGRALQETGRPDRALPLLRHVADRDPRSAEAMLALGRTLGALGEHDEARDAFDRSRAMDPDHSPGYGPHTASYMAEGKLDEALFWAVRTQELTPRSSDAGAWVLFLNDCLEDYGAADEWSSWLGHRVTNQPLPLAMLARHDFLTGQFQSAIQRSNLALRLGRPGNAVADAVFMRIKRDEALALGAPDEAIRLFRERRPELFGKPPRLSPDNVQQAVDLAQLMQIAGRRDAALDLLERVIEWYDQPFSVAGDDRSWLVPVKAEALAVLGRRGAALAELRRVVDAGWRVFWRWETDLNFNFNDLRNSPEFREMIRELAEDMARQRRQAQAMAGLGEMSPPSDSNRIPIP
jgi:tetratricopeptide (TPR) repeat protein